MSEGFEHSPVIGSRLLNESSGNLLQQATIPPPSSEAPTIAKELEDKFRNFVLSARAGPEKIDDYKTSWDSFPLNCVIAEVANRMKKNFTADELEKIKDYTGHRNDKDAEDNAKLLEAVIEPLINKKAGEEGIKPEEIPVLLKLGIKFTSKMISPHNAVADSHDTVKAYTIGVLSYKEQSIAIEYLKREEYTDDDFMDKPTNFYQEALANLVYGLRSRFDYNFRLYLKADEQPFMLLQTAEQGKGTKSIILPEAVPGSAIVAEFIDHSTIKLENYQLSTPLDVMDVTDHGDGAGNNIFIPPGNEYVVRVRRKTMNLAGEILPLDPPGIVYLQAKDSRFAEYFPVVQNIGIVRTSDIGDDIIKGSKLSRVTVHPYSSEYAKPGEARNTTVVEYVGKETGYKTSDELYRRYGWRALRNGNFRDLDEKDLEYDCRLKLQKVKALASAAQLLASQGLYLRDVKDAMMFKLDDGQLRVKIYDADNLRRFKTVNPDEEEVKNASNLVLQDEALIATHMKDPLPKLVAAAKMSDRIGSPAFSALLDLDLRMRIQSLDQEQKTKLGLDGYKALSPADIKNLAQSALEAIIQDRLPEHGISLSNYTQKVLEIEKINGRLETVKGEIADILRVRRN